MSLKDHDNELDTGDSEVHMTFKDEFRMSLKDAVHTSFRRLPLPAFNSPSRVAVKGFFFQGSSTSSVCTYQTSSQKPTFWAPCVSGRIS